MATRWTTADWALCWSQQQATEFKSGSRTSSRQVIYTRTQSTCPENHIFPRRKQSAATGSGSTSAGTRSTYFACQSRFSWFLFSLIFWVIFRPGTDLISLLILFLLGRPLHFVKNPKASLFQFGLGWNLAGLFFKSVYIEWWSHIFDLMSQLQDGVHDTFHATKCCHLLSEHDAFASAYAAV